MPTTLHESPSGTPVVIPDPPAPSDPPRFRRNVTGTNGGLEVVNPPGVVLQFDAVPFVIEFANPKPDRLYSVQGGCNALWFAGSGAPGVVGGANITLHIEASIDNAAFVEVAQGITNANALVETSCTTRIEAALRQVLGSAIGVLANSASLRFRLRASAIYNLINGSAVQISSEPFSQTAGGTLILEGTES